MAWTENRVIEFLNLLENYEVIWNPAHQEHRNKNAVHMAWRNVATAMGMPMSELKRKKESLMAFYRHLASKVRKSEMSKYGANYNPDWYAYESLDRMTKKAERTKYEKERSRSPGDFSDMNFSDLYCEVGDEDSLINSHNKSDSLQNSSHTQRFKENSHGYQSQSDNQATNLKSRSHTQEFKPGFRLKPTIVEMSAVDRNLLSASLKEVSEALEEFREIKNERGELPPFASMVAAKIRTLPLRMQITVKKQISDVVFAARLFEPEAKITRNTNISKRS